VGWDALSSAGVRWVFAPKLASKDSFPNPHNLPRSTLDGVGNRRLLIRHGHGHLVFLLLGGDLELRRLGLGGSNQKGKANLKFALRFLPKPLSSNNLTAFWFPCCSQ
jgi:hypothetical protein